LKEKVVEEKSREVEQHLQAEAKQRQAEEQQIERERKKIEEIKASLPSQVLEEVRHEAIKLLQKEKANLGLGREILIRLKMNELLTTWYSPQGSTAYWCHGCRRTFNGLTHTLFAQSKRSLVHWILATFLLCLVCSSRPIARELGVHVRTSYRWCWWLRNAALSYEMQRQLAGTVEADELYHTAGNKGQAHQGGIKPLGRQPRRRRKKREPGRGHYDKDRPAIEVSANRLYGFERFKALGRFW
jgi:hypothetical protein